MTADGANPEHISEQPATHSGTDLQTQRTRTALRRQEQTRKRGELERAVAALPPGKQTLC